MLSNNKIKVLIVDDSVLVRKYVSQILSELDNIEIVGLASNGQIALQKIYLYKPDVVILDIEMPEMTGLELLKHVKEKSDNTGGIFFIMFSSLLEEGSSIIFEALSYGAADFIKKPVGPISGNLEYLKREFDLKIKGLYQGKREMKSWHTFEHEVIKKDLKHETPDDVVEGLEKLEDVFKKKEIKPELIAIGSSTGGPVAVRSILDNLLELPVPLVIAQHMPAGFTTEFAKNLKSIYHREVAELSDGAILEKGIVYICPGGFHSRINKADGNLIYQSDANNYEGIFFKPSLDIFFHSLMESVGKNMAGIVLSGMGKDGSHESVHLRKMGALMIAQDQESSVIWGMPGNSVKSGGIDIIINIKDIGEAINLIAGKSR